MTQRNDSLVQGFHGMLSASPQMTRFYELIRRIARRQNAT